jgi:hypothetical protein
VVLLAALAFAAAASRYGNDVEHALRGGPASLDQAMS